MIVQKELIKIGVVVTIVILSGAFGYHKGTVNQIEKTEDARIALQEKILDLNENLSNKNSEILRLFRERESLINDLEQQAINADGANAPGISSTGGLQRLERRWSTSPASSE